MPSPNGIEYSGNFYYQPPGEGRGTRIRKDRIKKIVDEVIQQTEWAREGRAGKEEKWLRSYRQYRSIHEQIPNNVKTKSRLFIPVTFKNVEVATAKICGDAPDWIILPGAGNDLEDARRWSTLIRFFAEQAGLYGHLVQWVRDAAIFGTSFIKTAWLEEERYVRKLGYVPRYVGPYLENTSIFALYVDPNALEFSDAEFVIERQRHSALWLKTRRKSVDERGEPYWQNIDEAIKAKRAVFSEKDFGDQARSEIDGEENERLTDKREPIDFLEHWGYLEFSSQDGAVPAHVILGNGIPLRIQVNPFDHQQSPHIKHLHLPIANSFYGMGIPHMSADLQDEINVLRNMQIDELNYNIRPEGFVNSGSGLTQSDLDAGREPGRWIEVDGPPRDMVWFADQSPVMRNTMEQVQVVSEEMRNVIGIPEISQGIQMPSDTKTYGGIRALQNAADVRIIPTRRHLEQVSLKNLGDMWISLGLQYITDAITVRILGEAGRPMVDTMRPEQLLGNFDLRVKVKPGEPFSEQAMREELIFLVQTIQKDPTLTEYLSARGAMLPIYRVLFSGNEAIPNDVIDDILGVPDSKEQEGDFKKFMAQWQQELMAAMMNARQATAMLEQGGGMQQGQSMAQPSPQGQAPEAQGLMYGGRLAS